MMAGLNCAFVVGVAALCVGTIARPIPADETTRPTVLLSSRVATLGNPLTLPVRIDGQVYRFAVETARRRTALDPQLCGHLKPADEVEEA